MILPKARVEDTQLRMFPKEDIELKPLAARYYTGDFYEELTAAVTRGARLKTDSRADICPDVLLGNGLFVEVKSLGRNGSVIFYEDRHVNAAKFVAESPMVLFFWHHAASVDACGTLSELHRVLATGIKSLTILDFESFSASLAGRPLREFFKTGKRRKGWTVPISLLHAAHCEPMGVASTCVTVYDQAVTMDVPLYCSSPTFVALVRRLTTQRSLKF
jgi:hypothetical protein